MSGPGADITVKHYGGEMRCGRSGCQESHRGALLAYRAGLNNASSSVRGQVY